MSKIIEFSIAKELSGIKELEPIPAKINIPDWFRKMKTYCNENAKFHSPSIKACIPVLDSVTAGYLLPLPQDMLIEHNLFNKSKNENIQHICYSHMFPHSYTLNLNTQKDPQEHDTRQVGGNESFYAKKNGGYSIKKILNPWHIKTPAGYSCLFLPPMHRELDFFHIIPGIVDTDSFEGKINFPFIINNDKYKKLEEYINQGTPYVQVIPFKRDDWKMKIKIEEKQGIISRLKYTLNLLNTYKRKVWKKKKWI